MNRQSFFRIVQAAVLSAALIPMVAARAQFAVIDVAAIAQAIEEIVTLADQLTTMRNQLTQARSQFQAMTGDRGMQQLLSGTVRNYLPADWQQMTDAINQVGSVYGSMSADLRQMLDANTVLTPAQLALLSPDQRSQLESARQNAAMLQVVMREALSSTSQRFDAIQQLINAIPSASDQKGILDLQARISAEQGMLANEQTKLQVLTQVAQAEKMARTQKLREQAINDVGSMRRLPAMGL